MATKAKAAKPAGMSAHQPMAGAHIPHPGMGKAAQMPQMPGMPAMPAGMGPHTPMADVEMPNESGDSPAEDAAGG